MAVDELTPDRLDELTRLADKAMPGPAHIVQPWPTTCAMGETMGLLTAPQAAYLTALDPDTVRTLVAAAKDRDKFERFYKMAVDEHIGLGEEMTLRRELREAQEEIERLRVEDG